MSSDLVGEERRGDISSSHESHSSASSAADDDDYRISKIPGIERTHFYVSRQAEAGLALYTFHHDNHSIVENLFLLDIFKWVARVLPSWITPNVLTLLNSVCCSSKFLLVLFLDPGLQGTPTLPYWAVWGLLLLNVLSQFLDGVDGVLARYRKVYSPLGDLMDHAIDVFDAVALVFSLSSVLGLGRCLGLGGATPMECSVSQYYMSLVTVIVILGYVAFTAPLLLVEHYVTLYLRLDYLSTVEMLLFFFDASFLVTALFGSDVWSTTVLENIVSGLPGLPLYLIHATIVVVSLTAVSVRIAFNLVAILRRGERDSLRGRRGMDPSTGYRLRTRDVLLGVIPPWWILLWSLAWAVLMLRADADKSFFLKAFVPMCISFAAVCAYFGARMVLHRINLDSPHGWYVMELPVVAIVVFQLLANALEFSQRTMWVGVVVHWCVVAAVWLHFLVFAVLELSAALRIPLCGERSWVEVLNEMKHQKRD